MVDKLIKLVTYGDDKFYYSRKLLFLEALKVSSIDKIKVYKKNELPSEVLSSDLMKFNKGGGYWIWKPYIIYNELIRMKNDDILIYVDSGCSVANTDEWDYFYKILEKKSILLFKFSDKKNYHWNIEKSKNYNYEKLKCWTKKNTLNYFTNKYNKKINWLDDKNTIMAGLIICKRNDDSIKFFKKMYDEMLLNANLIIDPDEFELNDQFDFYCEHRHDQSVLSIMAYNFIDKYNIEIIDENIEPVCCEGNPAVLALRRVISKGSYITFLRELYKS